MAEFELLYDGQVHRVDLEEGEILVGRAKDCTLQIPLQSVSKHHAKLRLDGERLYVCDLGSTNGTEIDGRPVSDKETELPSGSTVRFASAALWRSSTKAAELSEDRLLDSSARFRLGADLSQGARTRIVDMLSSLFELLSSGQEAKDVENAGCEFVGKWVRAERVVMLADRGEGTGLSQVASWLKKPTNEKLRLSNTIVDAVMKQRESVLVADPMSDSAYANNESILALSLRSAMAAPLFDNERVRGILYVDTADPSTQYSMEDLQVLSATANAMGVKLRNLSLEGELRTAARIQREMVPDALKSPAGYELKSHQLMCRAVGGDLYHALERPDGKLLLALGDVSGKGMPAALAMSASVVLLRALARMAPTLDDLISGFHEQLLESLAPEQFLTLFAAELVPETGAIEFVNAGHNPPIVVRADGSIEELATTGLPVAMVPGCEWKRTSFQLNPGDLLTIYSDGIPEATVDGESFLGDDALRDCIVSQATAPLIDLQASILGLVTRHLAGQPNSDDVTLMLIRRLAD